MTVRSARGEGWELAWSGGAAEGAAVRYYAGFAECLSAPRQAVEPATSAGRLIVVFDDRVTVTSPSTVSAGLRSFVTGPRATPLLVDQCGSVRGVEVGLTATALTGLIGGDLGELGETVVSLDAVLGRQVGEMEDRLASESHGWERAFGILAGYLEALEGPVVDPRLQSVWDTIERAAGQVRIEGIAREVGWSRRHLAVRFHRQFGITPKIAARLFRFERATRLLRTGRPAAETAAVCGYFDQAHMSAEFARFGSDRPGQISAPGEEDSLRSAWPLDGT